MHRRTLIQSLFAWISLQGSRLRAQTASFPGKHESTLKELAATVLPESLGRAGTDSVALQFVRWVQEYRAGAEMQTGYGATRIRYKPASPAATYLEQLDQLSSGALAQSGIAATKAENRGSPSGCEHQRPATSAWWRTHRVRSNDVLFSELRGE